MFGTFWDKRIVQTKELQADIKSLIKKLKWSRKTLACEIFYELNENGDSTDLARFEESLKKSLTRETTKPELLQRYLNIISQHRDFKKLKTIVPQYHQSGTLSKGMEIGMKNISKLISNMTKI